MNKLHLLFSALMLAVTIIVAEKIATTDDGKKVTLRDNGTWDYVKETAPDTGTASAADHTTLIDIVKNDPQYDFRKAKWGMNRKLVMASETAKLPKSHGDTIEYEVQFLGYNCTVVYIFAGDVLVRAAFQIGQDHIDPALFYIDYENLKKFLVPQYGSPAVNRCDWVNEMYRADKAKWGFAVSLGFLTCSTRWESGRTGITLLIHGGNHLISTSIEYSALQQK
jgi:hypothetical protein